MAYMSTAPHRAAAAGTPHSWGQREKEYGVCLSCAPGIMGMWSGALHNHTPGGRSRSSTLLDGGCVGGVGGVSTITC